MMKEKKIIISRPNKEIYVQGDILVKTFDDSFKKSDILNEALNQSRVEECGLNIPKILDVGVNEENKWCIKMEYISGKSLEELMKEQPEKIDEYLKMFVELQKEMHTHNIPLLNRTKEKFTRKLHAADIDGNIKYELQMRLEGFPTHKKLCHGDYNPSNIIVSDDGKLYIIDWSHATTGNGAADAARTFLLFKLAKNDALAEKYMSLYCEINNVKRDYIQRWLPIVAASQSVKGKPEEREFLMSWVNVVQYE